MLVFVPIMLALCSMLAAAEYAQINARLIGATLYHGEGVLLSPFALSVLNTILVARQRALRAHAVQSRTSVRPFIPAEKAIACITRGRSVHGGEYTRNVIAIPRIV